MKYRIKYSYSAVNVVDVEVDKEEQLDQTVQKLVGEPGYLVIEEITRIDEEQ